MEYMDGGPLCGLVRQCGVLREPVLAEVTRQTLQVGTASLPVLGQCVPKPAAKLLQEWVKGWSRDWCQRRRFACSFVHSTSCLALMDGAFAVSSVELRPLHVCTMHGRAVQQGSPSPVRLPLPGPLWRCRACSTCTGSG